MVKGLDVINTLSKSEVAQKNVVKMRSVYLDLAKRYNAIIENKMVYCNKCNTWREIDKFYTDKTYNSGKFPVCKQCLQMMSEQRNDTSKPINETKESIQKVLRFMDKPYYDKLYGRLYKTSYEAAVSKDETAKISVFPNYITVINSLPQYKDKTWIDSDFGDVSSIDDEDLADVKIVKSTVANGRKRFGAGYSDEELMFLENEYQDWVLRYECNTKAQEKIFKNLAMVELQKDKAIKKNQPTKDLDKAYQDWLDAGNLKPKQNSLDAFSEAQSFGTLLQKYEETRPLPEIDPELEDVDKIGLYFEVFFRGHLCKVLGLKNRFANIYENFMQKFTVTPPENDDEDDEDESEAIFEKIFGGNEDG